MSSDQPRIGTDRQPPQNLEAERGVLGAILLDNDVFDDVAEIIKSPDDFYRDAHRIVYGQMLRMRANGEAIDAVTLADRLTSIGQFKNLGGDDLLDEIANSIPHAANACYHAAIVRQKAVTLGVIQAATKIITDGYSNLYTAAQLLDVAEKSIFAIRDKEVTKGTVGILEAVEEAIAIMGKVKNDGEVNWLLTGIDPLDKILLGMQGGQLIVLAGRPGAGKSAFAGQVANHIATGQNESTLLVSLEMKAVEFARRMIAARAGVNSKLLKNMVPLRDREESAINEAAAKVAMARLKINDTAGQTLAQIAANARRLRRKDNLGFLVVDYLQKIREPSSKNENRTTIIGRISTGLKELAKELDIPILALAQLNRESEKGERPPMMADLRESGDIEQDADVIMLLHNKTPKGQHIGPVDLIVAKNRDGEEGIVDLIFDRPHSTFTPAALSGQIRAADIQNDTYRPPYSEPNDDDRQYDHPDTVPFR